MGKGGFKTYKRTSRWVWRKIKYGSKTIERGGIENKTESRGGKIQKNGATRKVYGKAAVWMGWWKVRERVSEKVRKKLAKIEVSFSRGETLRGGNVKITRSGLSLGT